MKIDRQRHHDWLKTDQNYRSAWQAIQDQVAQALEDEAVRRAYEGVKRPMFYRGKPVKSGKGRGARAVMEVEYSDQLLILLLKRFRPAQYRERTVTEVTGSIDLVDRLQTARKRLVEMQKQDGQPDSAAG